MTIGRSTIDADVLERETVHMTLAGIYKHWLVTGRGDLIELSRKLNSGAALAVKALK